MARISPNDVCPCGSGRKYKKCCRPAHDGRPAPTAEALMRSRFSAYALGLADYIIATTDPAGPQWQTPVSAWKASIEAWCRETTFAGLTILEAEEGEHEGYVTFRADLRREPVDGRALGDPVGFTERSRFRKVNGRWLYHSGTPEG